MADLNRCVMCGATCPEGRQVCWLCEHSAMGECEDCKIDYDEIKRNRNKEYKDENFEHYDEDINRHSGLLEEE